MTIINTNPEIEIIKISIDDLISADASHDCKSIRSTENIRIYYTDVDEFDYYIINIFSPVDMIFDDFNFNHYYRFRDEISEAERFITTSRDVLKNVDVQSDFQKKVRRILSKHGQKKGRIESYNLFDRLIQWDGYFYKPEHSRNHNRHINFLIEKKYFNSVCDYLKRLLIVFRDSAVIKLQDGYVFSDVSKYNLAKKEKLGCYWQMQINKKKNEPVFDMSNYEIELNDVLTADLYHCTNTEIDLFYDKFLEFKEQQIFLDESFKFIAMGIRPYDPIAYQLRKVFRPRAFEENTETLDKIRAIDKFRIDVMCDVGNISTLKAALSSLNCERTILQDVQEYAIANITKKLKLYPIVDEIPIKLEKNKSTQKKMPVSTEKTYLHQLDSKPKHNLVSNEKANNTKLEILKISIENLIKVNKSRDIRSNETVRLYYTEVEDFDYYIINVFSPIGFVFRDFSFYFKSNRELFEQYNSQMITTQGKESAFVKRVKEKIFELTQKRKGIVKCYDFFIHILRDSETYYALNMLIKDRHIDGFCIKKKDFEKVCDYFNRQLEVFGERALYKLPENTYFSNHEVTDYVHVKYGNYEEDYKITFDDISRAYLDGCSDEDIVDFYKRYQELKKTPELLKYRWIGIFYGFGFTTILSDKKSTEFSKSLQNKLKVLLKLKIDMFCNYSCLSMLVTELKRLQSTPAVPELLDIQEYAIEKITQKLEQYPIINEIPVSLD